VDAGQVGKTGDVILGFDSLSGYRQKLILILGLVGRYANRISHAALYSMEKNTHLSPMIWQFTHGGLKGFDKVI
jgi:aldose 1-epimerase